MNNNKFISVLKTMQLDKDRTLLEIRDFLKLNKDELTENPAVQPVAAALSGYIKELIRVPKEKRMLNKELIEVCIAAFQKAFVSETEASLNLSVNNNNEEDENKSQTFEDSPVFSPDTVDPEILTEFINESLEHLEMIESQLVELESDPDNREVINAVFRAFHSTKGTASIFGFENIKNLAHSAEMLLDRVRQGEFQLTEELADIALLSADTLKLMITKLKDLSPQSISFLPGNYQQLMDCLSSPEKYISLKQSLSQEDTSEASEIKHAAKTTNADDLAGLKGANPYADEKDQFAVTDNSRLYQSIRVSVDKMEDLLNTVGELIITYGMLEANEYILSNKDRTLTSTANQMGKISRQLQKISLSLRMVPLKNTFVKMERAARDLMRRSGKTVQLQISGENTNIDRNLVEKINDPLMHLIRNAIDHGIEPPEERHRGGKPEQGYIRLHATHSADKIIIEIQDDGRGLNLDKIREQAEARHLISNAQELSESDITQYIFSPGFSTADKVTEISGRGVGLDVVKRNLESIQGSIEVRSNPGAGCVFTIRLPLTLAIIDGLLFKVGQHEFIIPAIHVRHIFHPKTEQVSTVNLKGEMIFFQNNWLPIFRLHKLLNISEAIKEPTEALVLIFNYGNKMCALMIDALVSKQQVVIKSLGKLRQQPGFAGAAILGDGHIRLILDAAHLLRLAFQQVEIQSQVRIC